jgi:hypothetical protein
MERLVDGFLRDESLASVPLHPYQRAYQAGKSVETARHWLVVRAEKALDQQETALGVSLDIDGGEGVNNTSYDSMYDVLVRHGVEYSIIQWIRAILVDLLVTVTLSGFSMRIVVSRVCPQEDVLSPLL